MAAANRITGKDLYVAFGGVDLSGDFTTVSFSVEEDVADVTAGNEESHYYIPMREDATIDFEAFYDGAAQTVWDAIAQGAVGTLEIGPKGTVSTYHRLYWSRAICTRRELDVPFDNGVRVRASFQASGTLVSTSYA